MTKSSSTRKSLAAILVFSSLFFAQLYSQNAETQTSNSERTKIINTILWDLQKTNGNNGVVIDTRPKVIVASVELQKQAAKIKNIMKQTGDYKQPPPTTIEEAIALLNHMSFCLRGRPTLCFEHDGVYYFSGGTSAKPIVDFSSGYAVRKGESKIYTWFESDKVEVDKNK